MLYDLKYPPLFGPIRSNLVLFSSIRYGPIWSTSIQFGPLCPLQSCLVHEVHFGRSRSTLVLFSPLQSYSVQFRPIQSTLVLLGPFFHFGLIRFTLVLFYPFGPLRSILYTLVLFSSHWSHLSYSVHFGPISSTSVHSSTLVLFGLLWLIRSYLVLFGLIWSASVHFVHFGSIQSISVVLGVAIHVRVLGSCRVNSEIFDDIGQH